MRTSIYIDGFNLYYGAVKDTPYKWLNLVRSAIFSLQCQHAGLGVHACYVGFFLAASRATISCTS
jgi:hypothetical protein